LLPTALEPWPMHQPDVEPLNTEALWLEALPILQVLWPELRAETYVRSLASMQARGYVLLGIRSGGTLVAVAGVQEIELLARGKILWLFDMATHPQHQGKGFGARLLRFVQGYAKSNGYSRLLLHTSASREAAIAFYRSQLGEPFGVVFRSVTGEPDV
jgi:ribosomal protein S18 acetylase RimI-like enzyme